MTTLTLEVGAALARQLTERWERHIGSPLEQFAQNCHAASIALVRSGWLGECRVARGSVRAGVGGQHSWVVLGDDPYDARATIVDPTLWSYNDSVEGVWVGPSSVWQHRPHQAGSIWEWGRPDYPTGDVVRLDEPAGGWSSEALSFLDILGPLDMKGWRQLAHAPVGGWPAGEIIAQMFRDERIGGWIPIDVVGMTTDINPGGLYLAGEERE